MCKKEHWSVLWQKVPNLHKRNRFEGPFWSQPGLFLWFFEPTGSWQSFEEKHCFCTVCWIGNLVSFPTAFAWFCTVWWTEDWAVGNLVRFATTLASFGTVRWAEHWAGGSLDRSATPRALFGSPTGTIGEASPKRFWRFSNLASWSTVEGCIFVAIFVGVFEAMVELIFVAWILVAGFGASRRQRLKWLR